MRESRSYWPPPRPSGGRSSSALVCRSPCGPPTSRRSSRASLRRWRSKCAAQGASGVCSARTGAQGDTHEMVLGVDTLVTLDGQHLRQARRRGAGARDAQRAVGRRAHRAQRHGAALSGGSGWRLARTRVDFREVDGELIDWYVACGEWRGRAGGYAIQGVGAVLVREIHGDYRNVVGLPARDIARHVPRASVTRYRPIPDECVLEPSTRRSMKSSSREFCLQIRCQTLGRARRGPLDSPRSAPRPPGPSDGISRIRACFNSYL